MSDFRAMSLADARRDYLANSTTAMPIGGLIAWGSLAAIAWHMGDDLPVWIPFTAAAAPVPIALLIDRIRGTIGRWKQGNDNPVAKLFMRFIWVITLLSPFIIIAAMEAGEVDLVILGMAVFAGMIWVPHGWGADDPAGFIHFIMRALLCYAAYLLVPEPERGAAVAAAPALTYVYAILAMKKPESAQ
ncbi:hypothetical protein B5C34_03440 [Pacificimonas flava]|uniref:Transmembrane protein n=2 Tax=Pacificimonas TaxID=1960290 RepID=A0A219B2P0_9SPHN|nr:MULTISPECIES: hypothetical protein [Pacificimonas]MBZ6377727.1 hypothetical protein [Pacificimonas aurantium]OWV32595.1 hypothetical protein B5C34_03440 [Pacificimonas flava]